ncbi:MAG: sulfite exporter TauE/SafE family protein [Proteobacteria bacterium]|nr:sulfite exporter TauE/SafE family protein [Pseudomonadota bacterium]MDA1285967.1 sulfite exporter TauE/SafE family protein [Pseudomonadota bacterium]
MELNLLFFVFAIPAVIFAGISKGGFGSGAAFAATPLMAMILDPGLAVGLMLPLLMVMDVASLKPYWKKWDWQNARVLVLGAIPGTIVAAVIFRLANPDVFRLLIGSVAIGFVLFQLARKFGLLAVKARPFNPYVAGFWGFTASITSFISHAGGPPLAVYLLSQRMDKTTYQATSVIVFWFANWMKFGPYLWLGIITTETVKADLFLAPFAVIGVVLGVYAHRLVPERLFFALTYTLLIITGLKLIYDGLT